MGSKIDRLFSLGVIAVFLFTVAMPPFAQAKALHQLRASSELSGEVQKSKAVKKFFEGVRSLIPLDQFKALKEKHSAQLRKVKKKISQEPVPLTKISWKRSFVVIHSPEFNRGMKKFFKLFVLSLPLTACFLFPPEPVTRVAAVPTPTVKPLPPFAPKLVVTDPVTDADRTYLKDLSAKGLQYFIDKVDPNTGYIVDQTYRLGLRTSTSNLGILLVNLAAAHELKKKGVEVVETRETVLKVLKNLEDRTRPYQTVTIGIPWYKDSIKFGFLPTWSDVSTAEVEKKEALEDIRLGNGDAILKRGEFRSDFSSLDAGNFAAGLMVVRQAFKEDSEITKIANDLLDGMSWELLKWPDGLMIGGGYFIYEKGQLKSVRLNQDWKLEGHSDSSLAYWVAIGSGKFDAQSFWKKNYSDDAKQKRRGDKEFTFEYHGIKFPYIGFKDNLSSEPNDRGDGGLFMRGVLPSFAFGTENDEILLQEAASQIAYATANGYKAFGISAAAGLNGAYHGWGGMEPSEVAAYASGFYFNLPGFEKSAIENLKRFKGDKYGPYDAMSASDLSKVLEGHTTWDLGLLTVNLINYSYDGLVRHLFEQDPISQKVRELYTDYGVTPEKKRAFEEKSKETLQQLNSLPQIRKEYRLSSLLLTAANDSNIKGDLEKNMGWMGLFLFNPFLAFVGVTQWFKGWVQKLSLSPIQRELNQLEAKIENILLRYTSLSEALKESANEGSTQLVINMMDLLVSPEPWIPYIQKNEAMSLVLVIDERLMKKEKAIEKLKSLGLEINRFQVISQNMRGKKFDLKALLIGNPLVRQERMVLLKTKLNGLEFWENSEGFMSILFEIESEKLNDWIRAFSKSNSNQIVFLRDSFNQLLDRSLQSVEQDFRIINIVRQQQ